MTTKAQTEANCRNALRSSGPRTPLGKAASSKNALRHGILSKDAVLPDEDAGQLDALRSELMASLQPEGALEDFLVDRIVIAAWRLRRVAQVEIGVFRQESESIGCLMDDCADSDSPAVRKGLAFIRDCKGADAFSKISRYETALERGLFRNLHELQRLQASRTGQNVTPPVVLDVTMDGFVSKNESGSGNGA